MQWHAQFCSDKNEKFVSIVNLWEPVMIHGYTESFMGTHNDQLLPIDALHSSKAISIALLNILVVKHFEPSSRARLLLCSDQL